MATTPVLLPGESHGQRSLEGYSPWGRRELDTTEVTAPTHHLMGIHHIIHQLHFFFFFEQTIFETSVFLSQSGLVEIQVCQTDVSSILLHYQLRNFLWCYPMLKFLFPWAMSSSFSAYFFILVEHRFQVLSEKGRLGSIFFNLSAYVCKCLCSLFILH